MEPGDCLVHHSFMVHGAPGISSESGRRRGYATRWFGESVHFDPRPGHYASTMMFKFGAFSLLLCLSMKSLICITFVMIESLIHNGVACFLFLS
jgi:hypothetical protein